jgi:aquaporin Z
MVQTPTPGRDRPRDELEAPAWPRRLLAEAFGTFALVVAAAGTDAAARVTGGAVSDAARAAAPGLVVAALVYSIGDASGAHFNPAVTLAFAVKRLVPATWLAPYWAAQLSGALLAAGTVRLVLGEAVDAAVSRPKLVDPLGAVGVEAILALLLLVVILGTADRFRIVGPNAALAVGATIVACGLIGLPIEGASMNPARSLGPAIVASDLRDAWIYVVGPVLGAIAAVVLTTVLHGSADPAGEAGEAARGRS